MADMLNIALSANKTFQRALDVTSHNVANVNTEGYNRQRAEIVSNSPQIVGATFGGGGSRVDTIQRVYADYVWRQQLQATSLEQRYDGALNSAKEVEGIIAANDNGVQQFLQRFFDSLQNLSNEPLSNVNRQMVLDEATNLESHIQNITAFLTDNQSQTNAQISALVDEVNQQLDVIQRANEAVFKAQSNGTFPPNDLLDKRDQAVMELGKLLDVRVFEQKNGYLDVYVGNGRLPLLSDNTRTSFTAERSPYTNEDRTEIYMRIGDQKRIVSDLISGGQLGGLLDFRRNMLDPAQEALGLTLAGFTAAMNNQHRQGWDLGGNPGGDLFAPLDTTALGNHDNAGAEDGSGIRITNKIADYTNPPLGLTPAQVEQAQADMVPRSYKLEWDGTQFQVFDAASGQNLGTIADGTRTLFEGLVFDTTGTAAKTAGDTYIVHPYQDMMQQFGKVISDPNDLATRGEDPNAPGTPAPAGDNTNIANLANLANKEILYKDASGQPAETILGGYSRMASQVGLYTHGTQINLESQQQVLKQVTDRMQSISGVNLDEEAANLMRFQQAYQASAQIIQVSNTLFDTLIGVIR
jgi:flagellar hook-associated protein 1 FlgK